MGEQDWIELARRAREAAERSLGEEAYWLSLAAGQRGELADDTRSAREACVC